MTEAARTTPLDALHRALGGRMVDFAGWSLPVQYPAGILAEHAQARERAALFDVSHMQQIALHDGEGSARSAAALEELCPGGLVTLKPGKARYTLFTNERGGVLDDLIVSNAGDHLFLVVNAARAFRAPAVNAAGAILAVMIGLATGLGGADSAAGEPLRLLALGDSLTAGYGLPQDEARQLLTAAFCREPLVAVDDPAVRDALLARLDTALEGLSA